MTIRFHRDFEKQYKKFRQSEKEKFNQRLKLFMEDRFNLVLNNHPLKGKFKNYRSINVTGDIRAIYKEIEPDYFLFVAVDSHSKLYS